MKDWREMSPEERKAARAQAGGLSACKERMDVCLRDTLALLGGDGVAIDRARSIALGCYLVNSPEEIAAYCMAAAEGGGTNV